MTLGALVAVGLGVFGKVHEPQVFSINVVMYRLAPGGRASAWISTAHVWSGRLAVPPTVPVAEHCLYALGFAETNSRVLFHSLFGCSFYGVFVTKMILLTRGGLRGWVIPIAGGLVFFGLVYVWLTSALWFFQTSGLTF